MQTSGRTIDCMDQIPTLTDREGRDLPEAFNRVAGLKPNRAALLPGP